MRPRGRGGAVVATGSALALAGLVHSVWNLRRLRVLPPADGTRRRISVLVPARDEAGYVGHCLSAIRAQVDAELLEILVLDDRSADGTAAVVQHHVDDDSRVRLIGSEGEPPHGWLGKTWACHQLAEAAKGEVLVFVESSLLAAVDSTLMSISPRRTIRIESFLGLVVSSPKTNSVAPVRTWSPGRSSRRSVVTRTPLTNVPLDECRSRMYH